MKQFLLERGKEASSWRGLVAILTATGIALDPAQADAIVAIGLAVIGVIGAFFPDKK
jgi:hypothetical protein